jgi:hypothetical protein
LSHNRARCDDAAITQRDIGQDSDVRTYPTAVPDDHLADNHGVVVNPSVSVNGVIGVDDKGAGTDHIVASDFDQSASIQHNIAIEIIVIPDVDANTVEVSIFGPKPRSLGQCIVPPETDLARATDAHTLEPTALANYHAQTTVDPYT